MKLYNQTIRYVGVSIAIIVCIWSAILYFAILDEIYDSIDDGLDNYKILIIKKASEDTSILRKDQFEESNYALRSIDMTTALSMSDQYKDTLMYMHFEDDMEPVRMLTTAFEQDEIYYELKILSSMVEEDDLMLNLMWFVISLFLIMILSFILINNYWMRRLWQPFYKILKNLKNFKLDKDQALPFVPSNIDEFKSLQSTSENLITSLVASYQHQKRFTENASHELQTPLAIAIGKIELLLENKNIESSVAAEWTSVLESLQRMSRLNQTLLTLVKIDNKQFFDNRDLNLNELIRARMEELGDFADFKNIKIIFDEKAVLHFHMDPSLAVMLLQNLIKNAIHHSPHDTVINIVVDNAVVSIENEASIGPLDASQIFVRFYKDNTNTKNTGLGLSIVQSIVMLYGLQIKYQYNGRHRFILHL